VCWLHADPRRPCAQQHDELREIEAWINSAEARLGHYSRPHQGKHAHLMDAHLRGSQLMQHERGLLLSHSLATVRSPR
jgi:hypothetical protein